MAWLEGLQSALIILASVMAAYSLDAWRREFMGKRRMELAEEVLALFYQARDVIEQIRSPVSYLGEGQTREAAPDERPEHKEALDPPDAIAALCGPRAAWSVELIDTARTTRSASLRWIW